MAGAVKENDASIDRLSKLLPAEVTGLYVTVKGLYASSTATDGDVILVAATVLIAIAGIFFLYKAKHINNFIHLAIYTTSFFIWVLTIESGEIDFKMFGSTGNFPLTMSILSVIVAFIVPLIIPSSTLSSQTAPPPAGGQ